MNILLVNPPNCGRSIPEENYGISSIKMIFRGEPLSLETLAGNLAGHAVVIADLKADPLALSPEKLPFAPDLIGLTGVTCEANTILSLAESLKSRFGCPVVVGGHHASCDPDFFSRPFIDHVVVGLGKLSFRQLVDAIETGRPPEVAGIFNVQAGTPGPFTARSYSTADLVDEQPPRYDLVQQHRETYVMSGVGGKTGFVASAFGCTHGCAFCCIPKMTDGHYLLHSNAAVVRDVQAISDVATIRLVDANTFGNVKTATDLTRRFMAAGIRTPLAADVRSDTVVRHPDLFALWHKAGLRVAVIGFEEISDRRLEMLDKRNTVATNIAATRILKDLGIRIVGDFIVSPDYTEADFDRLSDFIDHSGIDLPIPAILTPIPGTPLHRRMAAQIRIDNLDYYTFTNAVTATRMSEERFYRRYAALLEGCLAHVHPAGAHGKKETAT
ncbi:B12-binding domain-containing radical SAM protein [Desulfosarcina ovata]|uniref:B12-binding domain-containing radical SAM protein n=1 Tax=Desulfosarcina ovata subsp. ovata TaxID=2752305 RepID=A0A5K8ACP6_9BACT|nr:radical SAM protein [Desulfosarcina ovata]BBO90321.1 B12-binding domain-containing radical SAM protein [Desulfosarcina ovata subsp. ovata]